jgi:uncharacterized protein YciI
VTEAHLKEIRQRLDERLAQRQNSRDRLERLKKSNALAIKRAEAAKRILEKA